MMQHMQTKSNGNDDLSVTRSRLFVFGLIVGIFLAGGLMAGKFYFQKRNAASDQPVTNQTIQVEVAGAMVNPGNYSLDAGSRVFDALAAAGGLMPGADTRGLNLAVILYDNQILEVPYISDVSRDEQDIQADVPAPIDERDRKDDFVISTTPDVNLITATPFSCSDEEVIGSGTFVWPVGAHFLSGSDYSYDHPGIDLAAGMGSPVYAADAGMVRREGNDNTGYGKMIEIDHGNGYSTVYAHLSVIEVRSCQSVYAGQRIGLAGSTGNSNGVHLHFEVILDDSYIDPWSVLPEP